MEHGVSIMELKKNYFIVTKSGDTAQIIDIKSDKVFTDVGTFSKEQILNSSDDLHDLVEAGDYINGARVSPRKNDPTILSVNGGPLSSANIMQFMTKKKFYRECYTPRSLKTDKWAPCINFPMYEVSTRGIVRSARTGKIMSPLNDREQLSVRLEENKGGRRLRKSVAVLVLEAFVGPSNGRMPRFINNDNQDCSLSNLRWETHEEQASRVLQYVPSRTVKPKITNIVGYLQSKPVCYASNAKELCSILGSANIAFSKLSPNHLIRALRENKLCHGILFKSVTDNEYNRVKSTVNIKDFNKVYEDMLSMNEELVKGRRSKANKEVINMMNERIPQKELPPKQNEDINSYIKNVVSKAKNSKEDLEEPKDDELFALEKDLNRELFKNRLMKMLKED